MKKEDSLKDVPDKVSVIEVPSRRDLCSKSMFFVNCIHFHWHPMGDYCCVQSDLRGKKGVNHFLHVFAFGAKEIPVDLQEIKGMNSCDESSIHHELIYLILLKS